jgi:hypothetical protein
MTDINPSVATHFWMLGIESKGATDVYVVRVTFPREVLQAGISILVPSLITVVSGTLTAYDSNCTPHVYNAGECSSIRATTCIWYATRVQSPQWTSRRSSSPLDSLEGPKQITQAAQVLTNNRFR